jgi:hypothetical protein
MRSSTIFAMAVLLVSQPAGRTESSDEARALIGKAVKAMGMDKIPDDTQGFRTKTKGTLEVMGMTLNFEQTVIVRLPNQLKDVMELDVNNMKIPVVTVFDGKKGWVEANGKLIKLDDKMNAELKEVASMIKFGRLTPLLDNKFDLAIIGEVTVEEKPAVGIRVSTKGSKDFSLFFDKKTNLLIKAERQALDAMTGKDVQEERIIRSYQDKDGRKIPHNIVVLRDGKKFLEAEVTEHTPLATVDPSEFAMPK